MIEVTTAGNVQSIFRLFSICMEITPWADPTPLDANRDYLSVKFPVSQFIERMILQIFTANGSTLRMRKNRCKCEDLKVPERH